LTVSFQSALTGINHQSWFLEFRQGKEDLYPRLRQTMREHHLASRGVSDLASDHGDHSEVDRGKSTYEGIPLAHQPSRNEQHLAQVSRTLVEEGEGVGHVGGRDPVRYEAGEVEQTGALHLGHALPRRQ